ncbi:unnamed protein product [Lactuca saligna]|uniref:Uncharacterized protein n=1 Tax=Lactuca saligna TaxID=75948 RepID=A0AA36E1R7_LACSI|nr:unnamed protein product [Lactuca saligna]
MKNLYYREPEKSLCDDIRPTSYDVDYPFFIFDAYGTNGIILVYVDHVGDGSEWWFDEEQNEDDGDDSCFDSVENGDNQRDVEVENDEDFIPMNRTSQDPFLSKLCVEGVYDEG